MEENYNFSEEAFLDDLVNQLQLILSMPNAFQIRYKSVRIVHFENFQYSIHYRIKKEGIIKIYHILNQHQDF